MMLGLGAGQGLRLRPLLFGFGAEEGWGQRRLHAVGVVQVGWLAGRGTSDPLAASLAPVYLP